MASAEVDFPRESVAKLLAGGGGVWLDLDQPEPDDFEILRDVKHRLEHGVQSAFS